MGMTDKKQELSKIGARRSKLVYEAKMTEPDDYDILFQSAAICHCFMPRREPDQALDKIWEVESGKFSLYILPMPVRDPVTHELQHLGVPYGAKARIILANLNTIALKTQQRVIEMPAANLTEFNNFMGFSESGSQITAVRDQITRLASCVIRMTYDGDAGQRNINVPIVNGFTLFPERNPGQLMLWPTEIELSEQYFKNLQEHAVPLAKQHLLAMTNNVTALDWYSFLAHRLHRIPYNKPQFLGWQTLHQQFGGDYTRVADFRANFKKVHRLVKSLYTDARIEDKGTRGLTLHFSQTPIPKRQIVSGLDDKL